MRGGVSERRRAHRGKRGKQKRNGYGEPRDKDIRGSREKTHGKRKKKRRQKIKVTGKKTGCKKGKRAGKLEGGAT